MKNKDYSHINQENAELILAKIKEGSANEIKAILSRAEEEAKRIMQEARVSAENKRSEILKNLDGEIFAYKEKVNSTINIEKRRIILSEKSNFVDEVLKSVNKLAQDFRKNSDYVSFLKNSVLEGARVIDTEELEVFYSNLDSEIFNEQFKDELVGFCREKAEKDFSINFVEADFKDIGIIVQSKSGQLIFDNTFGARLNRSIDDIYMKLLKEAF
jgi:vacuolar-type H+-ATPase subunit E/Vma4